MDLFHTHISERSVELATEALRDHNARKLVAFMEAMPSAHADAPDLTPEQINALVQELRP